MSKEEKWLKHGIECLKPQSGKTNMARDVQALREAESSDDKDFFRLFVYSWSRPTVSLGFAQKAEQLLDLKKMEKASIDWVRRPSGGKMVLHDKELTYAVCCSAEHRLFGGALLKSYRAVSKVLLAFLRDLIEDGQGADGNYGNKELFRVAGLERFADVGKKKKEEEKNKAMGVSAQGNPFSKRSAQKNNSKMLNQKKTFSQFQSFHNGSSSSMEGIAFDKANKIDVDEAVRSVAYTVPRSSNRDLKAQVACYAMNGFMEITMAGRKLVGSAQKRGKRAFLQHGSIPLMRSELRLEDFVVKKLPVSESTVAAQHAALLQDLPYASLARLGDNYRQCLESLSARLADSFLCELEK